MAAITWSSELLTNGDFETANTTGWSYSGTNATVGYQCSSCNDPPHGGSYQAYWVQPSNSAYYLYQNVDLSSYAGDIDAGNAVVTATGWLISNEYPAQDLFYMQVRFYDGADPATSNEIAANRYDTGTMDVATWAQYGLTEYAIPSGARSLQVRFNTWEPTWDAGSADDFSVKVGITSGYAFRKAITIDNTKVGNSCTSSVSNYPLLVDISADNDLKTVANGGDVQNSSGYDIIFRDTSGNKLDHEVEAYSGTSGDLTAWVRVPAVSDTADTTIYIYYGNSDINSSQQNPTGVWDSNYEGVWHLAESVTDNATASGAHTDSTSKSNDGDQYNNNELSAQIDVSQDFEGNVRDEYVQIPNSTSLENVQEGDYTIESWFYSDANPPGTDPAWDSGYGVVIKNGWHLGIQVNNDGAFQMNHWVATGPTNEAATSNTKNTTTWYHVVGVVSKTAGHTKIYVNGVNEATNTFTAGAAAREYGTTPWRIGIATTGRGSWAFPANGKIDEVRISSTARDACWIETNFTNQSAPASFYSVGIEQSVGSPEYNQNSFRARNDNGNQTTSTWTAAANTDWTQMVDKNFRLRFLVQETAGSAEADKTLQLEYNLNSGGWNDVTGASSVVKAAASAYVADAADTTQQLGSGTFVTPNAGFDEANGAVGGTSLDFSGSDEVEVEYSLQVVGGDVSNGDTIELRVKGLDSYTNTPTITVTGAGTFSYKKSISIQSSQIGTSCVADLTDFAVMVTLTGADFVEVENDVDADGYDIIFKDATETVILDHEIEVYDETNDVLVAWVRIPTLDYNDNTTIYLHYGNSAVTAATENPTGVWDNNYIGVWHLNENVTDEQTSGTHSDSTANNNDGSQRSNVEIAGKFSDGQDLDGTSDYIEVSEAASLDVVNDLTVELWVNLAATTDQKLVGKTGTLPYYGFLLAVDGGIYPEFWDSSNTRYSFKSGTISANQWTHLAVTWQTNGNLIGYINSGVADSIPNGSNNLGTNDSNLFFGAAPWNPTTLEVDGIIDEVRISNTVRDACWIETEYNSQNSPAAFYSVGTEQPASSAVDLDQIHTRWRNDDGGESGGLDTGDGVDGAVSLSAGFNLNTAALGARTYPDGVAYRVKAIAGTDVTLGNASGATLGNANGIASGDEILLINLQGSSGDNGSVGNYELLEVSSVSGGMITVASAPIKDYDGSGNSFTIQKVFVQRVPNYTSVTTNGYTITAGDWDGGSDHDDSGCTDNVYTGIVAMRATGTVTVSSGGAISVNGLGYRGGSGPTGNVGGTNGESFDGTVGAGGSSGNTGTSGGGSGDGNTGNGTATNRGGGGGGGGDRGRRPRRRD